MERQDRERRKEEERLMRERQREEERSKKEQKREIERREKFLQKEHIRVSLGSTNVMHLLHSWIFQCNIAYSCFFVPFFFSLSLLGTSCRLRKGSKRKSSEKRERK